MSRSDIPFDADDSHAFLPWVIGIMACMAALLLCLGLTMGSWIVDRHHSYTDSFTVNIPASTDDMTAKVESIKGSLRQWPGVGAVSQVSDAALHNMLEPWLGNSAAAASLPLPVVLDVAIDRETTLNYKDLQAKLETTVPGVEVDAHERWIANFMGFSAAMQGVLGTLATLLVGSLALMIAFTSRAALKLHAKTVQLLHSIGAEDRYITRQFQQEACLLALRGALPGCAAAGIAYWIGGRYIASLQASLLPSLAMSLSHVALLLMMPLACAMIAWVAARLSVIKQLQRML